jgi:uncharacterized membrane protein
MSFDTPPPEEPSVPTGDATPPPPPPPPAAPTPPPPPPPAAATPPPPPPPPAGGPPQPGHAAGLPDPASAPWSVGNAFSYGWAKFQQYLAPILTAMVVLFVGALVLWAVVFFIMAAITSAVTSPISVTVDSTTGAISSSGGGPGLVVTLLIAALGLLFYFAIFGFIQGAVTRAALAITEGRPIETSTILSTDRLGPIMITALIVSVFTAIGSLFCYVGAIVVAFFLIFSFYFLLDQNLAPFDAVKASFNFVKDHISDVLVLFVVSYVAYFIGGLLCGLGLLVALPVVAIATAFTYKKLTNQAVAA